MVVAVRNQPYEKLGDLIDAQTTLVAGLARHGMDIDPTLAGFPVFRQRILVSAPKADGDVERYHDLTDTLQFDLWGPVENKLWELTELVDVLEDPSNIASGVLDSTNWKVVRLMRTGGWTRIEWTQRTEEGSGGLLVQLTSDWQFVYRRKQTV